MINKNLKRVLLTLLFIFGLATNLFASVTGRTATITLNYSDVGFDKPTLNSTVYIRLDNGTASTTDPNSDMYIAIDPVNQTLKIIKQNDTWWGPANFEINFSGGSSPLLDRITSVTKTGGTFSDLDSYSATIESGHEKSIKILVPNDDTQNNGYVTFSFTSLNVGEVANTAPTITGAVASQTVDDNATLMPFSAVTLADTENNNNLSMTITLDTNAKGVLSGTGLSGTGPYTLASDTITNVQAKLRALVFNPADNRVAPATTETTTFSLVANDGTANSITNSTTTVISTSVNDAPTISGTPNTTVNQDASYSFTPSASDVDFGQTLIFNITNKPSWADFNITTGKLSGTPTNSAVGTTNGIVISVTDSIATTNLASFNLQVVNLNDAPTLASISNITKSEDFTTFNVTITPADIDGDNLKLTVDMNSSTIIQIPTNSTDWITSANYSGGLNLPITAIANKSGVVELNVTVEDPSGAKTSKLFTITVNPQDDAPIASSMAATVGPNSQNTFDKFTQSFSDIDGDMPNTLRIETLPTVGTFEDFNRSGDGSWTTITTAPFEVAMSDLANYRFNAGNNNGLNTNVNWSIMTSYDNSYGHGLWSNIVTGVVTIIDSSSNNAPDVNITDSNGNDINGTIVTIDEDRHTNPIYITFSDDYTPSAFLVGVIDSNNTSKVSLADGDFNITRISDNNVSVIITPKANVYGDITITLGAFDGDKNGTKSFTLHINSINDTPTALNFEKTINEDDNYSFSTLNPTTVYSDTNDSIQNSNELYPDIFQIVSLPQHGILHLGNNTPLVADTNVSLANLGNLVYTPQENNNTDVSFTWRAFDGESWTQTKTATIYINAIDDAPALGTISNVSKQEDGSDFNVTLVSSDVEGDSITYTATSSNPSIAIVSIVNGKVVVTPIANRYGIVTVEVNATANGLTTTKTFEVAINPINDAPTIDTSFTNVSLFEDAETTNYDLNVSDIDGDDLNVTVTSSNPNIVNVHPNWNGLVNQANYTNLDFNITTVPNANGSAIITVTVKDSGGATDTTTFDINVTAINDTPTLATISDVIVYKNSGDKNITINGSDVDGDTLTYSAIAVDNTIVQSAIFTNNILTVKSIATGNSDINVTVTDGNLTTSKTFNFYVLPLEDGEDARVNDINQTVENNTTTTSLNINDDLTVKIQEGTNGKVSHDIIVNGKEIKATSQISGSVVAFTNNGVKTTYSDNTTDIEVDASLDGKAIHTLTSNGKTTKATSQFVGAQTVIKKDNNNKIEIETSVVIDGNTTVKVTAKEDGTAEHIVATNGKTSTALSKIAGAQTTITTSGQIDTEVINKPTTCSDEYIKAKVSTFANGKAQTKFVSYKCSDNSEIREVKTNTDATPYAPNNNVIIESSNGSTQIITTTPLEDDIKF